MSHWQIKLNEHFYYLLPFCEHVSGNMNNILRLMSQDFSLYKILLLQHDSSKHPSQMSECKY